MIVLKEFLMVQLVHIIRMATVFTDFFNNFSETNINFEGDVSTISRYVGLPFFGTADV